jgi:two-component system chemotaxis response regulator CheB
MPGQSQNPTQPRRDIIVIGGSAGAIEGVIAIVRALPPGLPAAIGIVVHHSAGAPNIFGQILARLKTLPVVTVAAPVPMEPGTIYVPISDHHLLFESDWVRTSRSAKENRARPAVDPLFRSAARSYGPRVVGVILSGNLDDGTAGLFSIKRRGGLAVVQDPKDAIYDGMPSSAVAAMKIDHVLPLAQIPELLVQTTSDPGPGTSAGDGGGPERSDPPLLGASPQGPPEGGRVAALTCPTCHGALAENDNGAVVTFQCHTGHTFGIDSLLASQDEDLELALWSAVRVLQERIFFLGRLSQRAQGSGPGSIGQHHVAERERLQHHVATLRRLLEAG